MRAAHMLSIGMAGVVDEVAAEDRGQVDLGEVVVNRAFGAEPELDAKGQLLISACVIPHLWHVTLGGIYQRQESLRLQRQDGGDGHPGTVTLGGGTRGRPAARHRRPGACGR